MHSAKLLTLTRLISVMVGFGYALAVLLLLGMHHANGGDSQPFAAAEPDVRLKE